MPSIKTDPPKGYFDRGTELGEAAFGYWLWVCIALAMLVFHVRGQCSLAPAHERDAVRTSSCTLCGCVPAGRVCPAACHDSEGDRLVLSLPGAEQVLGGNGAPCCFVCLQPCGACGRGPRNAAGYRAMSCPRLGGPPGEDDARACCCLVPSQAEMPPAGARPAGVQTLCGLRPVLCRPWIALSEEIVAAPVSWLSGPACVLLHLFLLTHEVLFALSLASYSHVHQKDHRNHAQTMLGLGVSLGATAAGHLVLVRAQCLAAAVAVPPEEAVATARRGGPASLEASPSLPGPLLRPLTAGQAGAAPRSGASDASGLGARTLWERYVASSRSRRAKAEGRVLAPAEARRPPVEYGASQSVNAYEAAASSGTLLGIEASPQPADLAAHLSDVHSGHAIRAAMGEDPRWQDEDGEASLSARRAARSAPRSSSSSCCCHRDTVGEWGCFGGMDASAAIATGHLAPLLLEAATAPRGATAASSAEIHGPSRAMEGQDCIRLWLCSRPTARNLATPHGAAHLLLVAVCVAWYVVWFFGTLVLVGLDTHPWGSWAGASG